MPDEGTRHWRQHRTRLRRLWWIYLIVGLFGTFWFIGDLPPRDPLVFAVLLLIPILSLWQAWKVDRQIVSCDARLAELITVNGENNE
jgi:hypothetical protein